MSLVQKAVSIKKPNKAYAQQIVKQLADKHPESENLLAELYAFFIPALPKTPKNDFQWVAQAVAKNDVREYLSYVYVTDSDIVATDGHRLHMTENRKKLEPGYYLPNGDRAHSPDYLKYPDYRAVIPKESELKTVNIDDLGVLGSPKLLAYEILGSTYQKKFIDQAIAGSRNKDFLACKGGEGPLKNSLLIARDHLVAVTMPVRI